MQKTTSRRVFIKYLTCSGFLLASGCAEKITKPVEKPKEPIEIDSSDVTDIPSLINSIRRAGGKWIPKTVKDEDFLDPFANLFITYAHAAADNGYPVPNWILSRLPNKKVIFPILGVATFPLWGITFTVPTATIITAVLGSITIMTTALVAAIKLATSSKPEPV
jgi:hypothetical protein